MSKKCDVCNSGMILQETRVISSTTYNMWFCPKCKKKVAKSA